MNLSNQFLIYLVEKGDVTKYITAKNYLADVRKFIKWYEHTFEKNFPPPVITQETVSTYLESIEGYSPRSAKRYRSSLRKFFKFMTDENLISYNPLLLDATKSDTKIDTYKISEFKNYLFISGVSSLSSKNYISDIRQFIDWAEKVMNKEGNQALNSIDKPLLEEYKERLLHDAGMSPKSINRKLSSLRKYLRWNLKKGLIKNSIGIDSLEIGNSTQNINKANEDTEEAQLRLLQEYLPKSKEEEKTAKTKYSKFPPLRLLQKSNWMLNIVFDSLIIGSIVGAAEDVKYNLWKITGKEIFRPVSTVFKSISTYDIPSAKQPQQAITKADDFLKTKNFSKSFYAPHKISLKALSLKNQIIYHLKHTRPKWYKTYHSYPVVHYAHFIILMIFATSIGFSIYNIFTGGPATTVLASESQGAARVLAFRGQLEDSSGLPINTQTPVRFTLYNNPTASGSALLWQDTFAVNPDENGTFTVYLGKNAPLTQDIFTKNSSVFLGISIGTDDELKPRQQIANIDQAQDSYTLQGLRPISENNNITSNVILSLDSSGNLTIGGNANPVFQATGGEFSLAGQQLKLTTINGSNGNIAIIPDGTGIIDLQRPLQNTSKGNILDIAAGALEVQDNLLINATTTSQSALVVNQNSTGRIISAMVDGVAKFVLENDGSASFTGKLSILGDKLESESSVFNLLNENVLKLNIGGDATSISIGASTGDTVINNNLTISKDKNITLTGAPKGAILFTDDKSKIASDSANLFWDTTNKRLGIGTNTPGSRLAIANITAGTGTALVIDSSGNVFKDASSRRYKENITPFNTDFSKILDVSPVSFKYKNSTSTNIGYIAEDFHTLGLQNLVIYDHAGKPDGIKYDKLTLYIIEILKTQQKLLDELETFMATIKNGTLELAHLSVSSVSIASENVTIGGQKIRDYIVSIVHEVIDEREKKNEKPTVIQNISIVSPLASDNQTAFHPASNSASLEEDTRPNPTDTPTPTLAISPTPVISPDPSINNNATSSAKQDLNITENAEISPIATSSADIAVEQNASSAANQNPETNPPTDQQGTKTPEPRNSIRPLDDLAQIQKNALNTNQQISTSSADISNLRDQLTNVDADFGNFREGLISLGPTSLTDLSISSRLTIGSNMIISDNSINTVGSDLSIQPLRQGNLSIMGGLISIDTKGNLTVEGDAKFAGNVEIDGTLTTRGKLAAGVIAPIPDEDLIFNLNGKSNIAVKNSSGSAVLSINQNGDIASSGSANFAQKIESKIGQFSDIRIVRGASANKSFTETVASSSAGTATISAHEIERTITTPFVTEKSLIYITPTSDPQGQTPYVARQTIEDSSKNTTGSFTVRIPRTVPTEIKFNWWIIN